MFPLSVMNLLLETTLFCTLCQNWLRLEPHQNACENLRHGQVSDLGHAGPAICDLVSDNCPNILLINRLTYCSGEQRAKIQMV